jgi:hypothetical protein
MDKILDGCPLPRAVRIDTQRVPELDVLVKKAEPVACFFSVRDPASCLRGSIRRCRMFLAKGLHQVSEAQEDDINI